MRPVVWHKQISMQICKVGELRWNAILWYQRLDVTGIFVRSNDDRVYRQNDMAREFVRPC
jgi:hypothetical protein